MYNIEDLTELAKRNGASDIHLVCGLPPKYRLDGQLENMADERLSEDDCGRLCQDLAKDAMYEKLEYTGELDFSREIRGIRCRCHVFKQQGKVSAAIRLLSESIPKLDSLGLPPSALEFTRLHKGIVLVTGETGSGKTELVKYLASHIKENEKIITIEDTLELHLDRIFPHRDIVALKTNNIASYSDVLVACMRQNPIWILLSEVRSAEAVMAVRNSISSGHHILSTIHSDKASLIPMRMFSLIESNIDVEQFVTTIHRYVQIGIYVKGYMSKELGRFQREILEVCEFYVDEHNKPQVNTIYKKTLTGDITMNNPTKYLRDYLGISGIVLDDDIFKLDEGAVDTKAPVGSIETL